MRDSAPCRQKLRGASLKEKLEMILKRPLFQAIDHAEIGLSISGSGSMRPVMSVSGFVGIGDEPAILGDCADTDEYH